MWSILFVACGKRLTNNSPLLWMSLARASCSCNALNFVEPKQDAAGITVAAVAELLLVIALVVLLWIVLPVDAVSSNDFSNDAIGAAPSRFCFRASIPDALTAWQL